MTTIARETKSTNKTTTLQLMIVFPPRFLLLLSCPPPLLIPFVFLSASLCNFSFCQRSMQFPPSCLQPLSSLSPKFSTQNFVLLSEDWSLDQCSSRRGETDSRTSSILSALLTENKAKYTCFHRLTLVCNFVTLILLLYSFLMFSTEKQALALRMTPYK